MGRRLVRWLAGVALALAVVAAGAYVLMNARTFQLFGDIIHRVEATEPVVALTFDDGPTPAVLDVLDVLDEAGVDATFFVTGDELSQRPELGERIVDSGHELGNHSWSHERMLLMSRARIADEIERTDEAIARAGQPEPILFRPPYGKKLFGLPRYLAEHDRLTVMADVEPDSDPEIASDPERIVDHVAEHAEPGSIILLHVMYDANEPAREALPGLVQRLRDDGYEFATVSDVLDSALE